MMNVEVVQLHHSSIRYSLFSIPSVAARFAVMYLLKVKFPHPVGIGAIDNSAGRVDGVVY